MDIYLNLILLKELWRKVLYNLLYILNEKNDDGCINKYLFIYFLLI